MNSSYEERLSDSPFVDRIGQFQVEEAYSHQCSANVLWNMLVVRYKDEFSLSLWGPMIESGLMNYPEGSEFLFIAFKLGSFMPRFPVNNLMGEGLILPDATKKTFWLDSTTWQYPTYENADTFVDWLVRDGLLVHEPIVDDVMTNQVQAIPSRTTRYRFLRATGVTQSYIRQVDRAQQAVQLLQQGISIIDTVYQLGYADQPHLTRSLKRLIGQTPSQIVRQGQPE